MCTWNTLKNIFFYQNSCLVKLSVLICEDMLPFIEIIMMLILCKEENL